MKLDQALNTLIFAFVVGCALLVSGCHRHAVVYVEEGVWVAPDCYYHAGYCYDRRGYRYVRPPHYEHWREGPRHYRH